MTSSMGSTADASADAEKKAGNFLRISALNFFLSGMGFQINFVENFTPT